MTSSSNCPLSTREMEVLAWLHKGYTYSEIANNMNCTLSTAKTYGRRIHRKLGVSSRSEAIHAALNQGLI